MKLESKLTQEMTTLKGHVRRLLFVLEDYRHIEGSHIYACLEQYLPRFAERVLERKIPSDCGQLRGQQGIFYD
jgi:hypothetical protein